MALKRVPGRPFKKGEGGRPKGVPNKATRDIKAWARGMLEDPDYRASLKARLASGQAGQVEALLYHYGYGKPKEQVELSSGLAPLIVEVTGLDPTGDD